MTQNEIDLSRALYYEHMGRTGHDARQRTSSICRACLYLSKLMDKVKENPDGRH